MPVPGSGRHPAESMSDNLRNASGNGKIYNLLTIPLPMKNFLRRLSQLQTKTVITVVLLVTLLLGVGLFSLWLWAARQIELVITEQFNGQQLMLARKIVDNVETYFSFLKVTAITYTQEFDVEYGFSEHVEKFLRLQLDYLKSYGILAVVHFDRRGQPVKVYTPSQAPAVPIISPLAPPYLAWAQRESRLPRVMVQQIFPLPFTDGSRRRVVGILSPLRLTRYNAPEAIETFEGVLQIIADPQFVAQEAVRNVRSGQTGYAWIVDHEGIFLAHFEESFIGLDHIEARRQRNPAISFDQVEQIVNQRLLRGQEGSDTYISGWHREKIGVVKKLLAFTPIDFLRDLQADNLEVENPERNLWGVGVVAPVEEVAGLVERLQLEQGLIIGAILLVLFGAGSLLIGAAYSWNQVLTHEVAEKTEALRRSHERLLRSERFAAVGEAAAYVSHEIKNPLMVIGGFAQQLKRHPDIPTTAVTKLEIIAEEVKRLESFLGELRDFTRPAPPVKQKADLNDLVRQVTAMMGEAASESGVQLTTRLADNLPLIPFDVNQMKQVLINLIKNALEAQEGSGSIMVSTWFEDDRVLLAVHDTGPGIPPDILPNIFNPFFTTKKTGTGLGLAVINKIIEDHHGTITVHSSKEEGTTFTISLPSRQ